MTLRITKILCPVDFSPPSNDALTYAIELARQFGAEIHLVHVYQNPGFVLPMSGYIGPQADMLFQMRAECETALERGKGEVEEQGVTAQSELLEGVPHQEIIAHAQQLNADLIVIGSQGRTGLAHVLLGSVAEKVVRLANRPVLVVPRHSPAH